MKAFFDALNSDNTPAEVLATWKTAAAYADRQLPPGMPTYSELLGAVQMALSLGRWVNLNQRPMTTAQRFRLIGEVSKLQVSVEPGGHHYIELTEAFHGIKPLLGRELHYQLVDIPGVLQRIRTAT